MKADKNTQVGAIMQIGSDDEHALALMVVDKVESWGVRGYLPHVHGTMQRSWSAIEPTGGVVRLDREGKTFAAPAPPMKHHP